MAPRHGRREEILATFIRHVAARGYEQTNLGDIATELGMSKGTIVHHFGTKAQMLRELEDNYMSTRRREVELIWERLDTPAERVAALIYASAMYQTVDRDATIASQREIVQLADDPAMVKIRGHRDEIQRLLHDELRRGIKTGAFRDIDPTITTLQIFGSAQWMWTWFDPAGRYTAEQIGASYVDVFLGGLLSDRFTLKTLADPAGALPQVVRECIEAAKEVAAA